MTVVPTAPLGYLTTWPAGSPQPVVSTLNDPTGTVTSNAAIVPAGVNGAITVYVTNPTDLIIDINGYFAPPGAGSTGFLHGYPVPRFGHQEYSGTTGRSDHGGRAIAKLQRAIIPVRHTGDRESVFTECDGGASGVLGLPHVMGQRKHTNCVDP